MSNLMLGWPNRADPDAYTVTATGGSWRADPYERSNMLDPDVSKVARSTDKTVTSTKVLIDLGTARTIRVLSELQHNFPQGAQRKVSAGTTSGGTNLYAGSWHDVWGITFAEGGVEWQDTEDWWGPEIDASVYGNPFAGFCILPSDVTARYWTVEWNVSGLGDDDYLQIGRLIMCPVYQPDRNAIYGLTDGWVDHSTKAKLDSGGNIVYARRASRTVEFGLPATNRGTEEYRIHEMLRRQRTGGEVLYVPDPEKLERCQMRGFLGQLEQLSGMQTHIYKRRSIAIRLTEKA